MSDDCINYDFGDWEIISVTIRTTRNYLMGISNIIFTKDDIYYFIEEERDSIANIVRMPDYIRSGWIRYNKKELTADIIDLHIAAYNEFDKMHCSRLLSLKREIKINSIKKNKPI